MKIVFILGILIQIECLLLQVEIVPHNNLSLIYVIMQEFTFKTSELSIYEVATFVKQFAVKYGLVVEVCTSSDSIHVALIRDAVYTDFSNFILDIKSECLDRNLCFIVSSVLYVR